MAQSENKPKLSDVARQHNTAKSVALSSTMIPPPPKLKVPPVNEMPDPAPVAVVESPPAVKVATIENPVVAAEEKPTPAAEPAPAPIKVTRSRKGGALTIDEVINNESPKGEPYPRQVRIAERHHKLLRKLAFTHDKTINHILYNLLEALDQADQRDQQKGGQTDV